MEPELVDTTGETCPICLDRFDNGTKVAVLQCGGYHMVCETCCDYNDQTTCPLCRREADVGIVGVAMNYPQGKTADDPIEIDDDEEMIAIEIY